MNTSASQSEVVCQLHRAAPAAPPIARILVVVDPTATLHACIDKAARIAIRCGAALELYICDDEQDCANGSSGREARHERYLEMLECLARPLRSRSLDVETHCDWAMPLERGIGLHVIRTRPDLVVKDTHHHPASRAPLTLTDWILIRQVPAPLLLVRPVPWPDRMRIVVSIDPCHPAVRTPALDEAVLAMGCLLGSTLRADLDAIHVLELPPHLPGDAVLPADKAAYQATARSVVEEMIAAGNNCGVRIPLHFAEGPVAERIMRFSAEHRPQLMVLGAAGRPRWAHAEASGTAAQILESIECDMLVVKPPRFVSPLLVTGE